MPASLEDLEAVLAAQDDATGALALWCARHGLPETMPIRVERLHTRLTTIPPIPAEARSLLEVPPSQKVGFRHVQLTCGHQILSEARNWFVPDRLTTEMNLTLAETDTPFGEAVDAINFSRERLESITGPGFPDSPPETILTHRALLRRPDRLPIALVVECYQPAALSLSSPSTPSGFR